jgi:hypothetical protein
MILQFIRGLSGRLHRTFEDGTWATLQYGEDDLNLTIAKAQI